MEYVISASELFQMAKKILNDGMDFVSIDLLEEDTTDPSDPIPPSVHFDAFKKSDPECWVDYEEIYVVPQSEE